MLLSVEDHDEHLGVFLTNDTVQAQGYKLKWSLEIFNGDMLEAGIEDVVAAPLATTPIRVFDLAPQLAERNRRDVVFVGELWQEGKRVALTTTLFVPDKHARLSDPFLESQLEVVKQQLVIRLHARSLARFIEVTLPGHDLVFSDNYFDLPAGETATLTCSLPEGWTLTQEQQALQVRSLFDSY